MPLLYSFPLSGQRPGFDEVVDRELGTRDSDRLRTNAFVTIMRAYEVSPSSSVLRNLNLFEFRRMIGVLWTHGQEVDPHEEAWWALQSGLIWILFSRLWNPPDRSGRSASGKVMPPREQDCLEGLFLQLPVMRDCTVLHIAKSRTFVIRKSLPLHAHSSGDLQAKCEQIITNY
jgi:hypothetical protein